MPEDRVIDGADQTDFFLGKQTKSNRESVKSRRQPVGVSAEGP